MLGWDLAQLGTRISIDGPAWDFSAIVADQARSSRRMLDVDTGGGEWLASLPDRARHTVATESWAPNVPVARERLGALGIDVIAAEPVPDNIDQHGGEPGLPVDASSFDLVVARHAAYVPREIARALAPGATFLTQQVGGDYGDFYDALGLPRPHIARRWTLELATAQLRDAGLTVVDGAEGVETTTFADSEALAWYLSAVPWTVAGATPNVERVRMPLRVRLPAFWLRATRPR